MNKFLGLVLLLIVLTGGGLVLKSPQILPWAKNPFIFTNTEKIINIEIETNGKTTILKKQGEEWKIASGSGLLRADETAVKGILGALGKITREEVVSVNKERWGEFGVEKGLRVKIGEAEFFVGREGLVWTKNYLRFSGGDETYLSGENLRMALLADDWIDKTATGSGEKK